MPVVVVAGQDRPLLAVGQQVIVAASQDAVFALRSQARVDDTRNPFIV